MTDAEAFFYEHAGFSFNPATETREDGKRRCAQALARAEAEGAARGWHVTWEIDPDATSADWVEDGEDGSRGHRPWRTWLAILHDEDGTIIDSLGGVDFGRHGEPWGDNYTRVVRAEMMLAALDEKEGC